LEHFTFTEDELNNGGTGRLAGLRYAEPRGRK
jgi:hypothetical protein